jgi:hypothetical protein
VAGEKRGVFRDRAEVGIVAAFGLLVLALAVQDPAQSETSFAFAHTGDGAIAWNIGRLERLEGRNAFNLARLHYFTEVDVGAGRPSPFMIESVDIDCDGRRYTSKFRVWLEPRQDSEHRESLYLAANDTEERTAPIRVGTAEYSVFQSACLNEEVQGYFIVRMTTMDALAELVRFSENHPVEGDVLPGEEVPASPAEEIGPP